MRSHLEPMEAAAISAHAWECARIAGEYLMVDPTRIMARDNSPQVAEARQIVWAHMSKTDLLQMSVIGSVFDRDHSTISSGVARLLRRCSSNRYLLDVMAAMPRYSPPTMQPIPAYGESLDDLPVRVLQEQLERSLAYSARLASTIAARLGIERARACRWIGCGSALDERDFCIEQSHDNRESPLRLVEAAVAG